MLQHFETNYARFHNCQTITPDIVAEFRRLVDAKTVAYGSDQRPIVKDFVEANVEKSWRVIETIYYVDEQLAVDALAAPEAVEKFGWQKPDEIWGLIELFNPHQKTAVLCAAATVWSLSLGGGKSKDVWDAITELKFEQTLKVLGTDKVVCALGLKGQAPAITDFLVTLDINLQTPILSAAGAVYGLVENNGLRSGGQIDRIWDIIEKLNPEQQFDVLSQDGVCRTLVIKGKPATALLATVETTLNVVKSAPIPVRELEPLD